MSWKWTATAMLATALSACTAADEPVEAIEAEPVVAKTAQPLQLFNGTHVHLVDAGITTSVKYSVAALRLRNISATAAFGSCGLTWVSQHYGVTAAHCVSHLPLRQESLIVEEIYLDQLDPNQTNAYVTVNGSWPNFSPGGTLTTGHGTTRYNRCYVSRRCSTRWGGREGCPIAEDVDIALIKCSERQFYEHAETAEVLPAWYGLPENLDDQLSLNINVWWFHEIYNLPVSDDGTDRWRNYGAYGGTGTENLNWHYTREHQLLPLVSDHSPSGDLYRTVAFDGGILNTIDAPICHGTSGSGVFISGTNIFLGPAVSAGNQSEINGKLCEPVASASPGESLATYVSGTVTASFVRGSPEVATDYP